MPHKNLYPKGLRICYTQLMKKRVLITGATKGIGKSIAKELSDAGFDVFISGRNEDALQKTMQEIGAVGCFAGDLIEDGNVLKLYESAKSAMNGVDVLINNAGEYLWSKIESVKPSEMARLLKLNLEVPYMLTSLAVPSMKNQNWGRIVNIGSISGAVGEANASLYSASKAGLIGMSKSLALELAEFGITVNTINPGWVETELLECCLSTDEAKKQELECIPQKRFIHPEEIAKLVKYLLQDDSKGLTGQSINLCAGLSLG